MIEYIGQLLTSVSSITSAISRSRRSEINCLGKNTFRRLLAFDFGPGDSCGRSSKTSSYRLSRVAVPILLGLEIYVPFQFSCPTPDICCMLVCACFTSGTIHPRCNALVAKCMAANLQNRGFRRQFVADDTP